LVEHTADTITRENPVVAESLLDSVSAAAFRVAAVRLGRERPQSDEATAASRDAAQALVSLSADHDESVLGHFLRPDPRVAETTWTVACYQIGDLTPCALLDFANPVAAVDTLAHCGEASHVAAELVASTPAGTRWTALTRTGAMVRFQLPDSHSASDATRDRPGELSLAARHWREQLNRWATEGGGSEWAPMTAPGRPVKVPQAPNGHRPSRPTERRGERPQPVGLEQALELVLDALRSVEVRAQPAGPSNTEVLSRLDDLDRRMSEFQAAVGTALEQRLQGLANYTAELARGFAAQQSATASRLEARLDEVLDLLTAPSNQPER
jgi:hypothetical protein